MNKKFLYILALTIIYFGCSKKNGQSATQTSGSKSLYAVAGRDTTICKPYAGSGRIFQAMLDGSGSHDSLGSIVSYTWTQYVSGASVPIVVGAKAITPVEISTPGNNTFWLEVKDNEGRIAQDSVTVNVMQNFEYEYDSLSWDSAVGALATISERYKPGLIESWPDFTDAQINNASAFITTYTGQCEDVGSWQMIPYVPYDSIQLTTKSLFYTVISGHGGLFPEVFASKNSGIDFNQIVSIGFDINSGAGDWDY